MPFFDIDYDNVVWTNLPTLWRQSTVFAMLKALVAGPKYVYNLFMANRTANLYYLNHNSQVCYMEAALNDTFDNTLRRIYMSDGSGEEAVDVYLVDEADPDWLGLVSEEGTTTYADPLPLFTYAETLVGMYFIVHVPAATLNTPYMRALIDKYRLPGRNAYAIVTF